MYFVLYIVTYVHVKTDNGGQWQCTGVCDERETNEIKGTRQEIEVKSDCGFRDILLSLAVLVGA